MDKEKFAKKLCATKGCDAPRLVNSTGRIQAYCHRHFMEKQNSSLARRQLKRNAARVGYGAINRNCIVCGENKPAECFDDPKRGKPATCIDCAAKQAAPVDTSFKVCIIDYKRDFMIFYIDGKVTRRTHTHINEMKSGGFALLLDGYANQNWHIIERGTPPAHAGIRRNIDLEVIHV